MSAVPGPGPPATSSSIRAVAVRTPYPVRPGGPEDLEFLWEMLHEAAHHRPLSDPAISRYLEGWRRPGDEGVVALDPVDSRKIGAAWYRLMSPDRRGYGFIDASTPEIVIAVVPDCRGLGVGGALLRELLNTARLQGFDALSLSVRCQNSAAVNLYERNGFVKLFDVGGLKYPSWAMKVDLSTPDGT
jgi:ribosomal protein S18 acetylase RimI-like enzyme